MKSHQHWWGRLCPGQFGYTLQFGEENKPFDVKSTHGLISLQEINKLCIAPWSCAGQSSAALGNPRLHIEPRVGCRAWEAESCDTRDDSREEHVLWKTAQLRIWVAACKWMRELWERERRMLIVVGVKCMWTKYWTRSELHEGRP